MTAAGRQDAVGGASALQLFAAVTDPTALVFQAVGSLSGWVFSEEFTVCIDAGLPSEEKIRCSAVTGTTPATFTVEARGYDDTTASAHGAGATVTHVLPAAKVMDWERHVYDTAEDDHTQYLDSTRHADDALHEFGAGEAFGAGTTGAADIGTAAQAGTGTHPARDDHVHQLGSGSIDTWAQFAAGVLGVVGELAPIGTTPAVGSVSKLARIDHVHEIGTGAIDTFGQFAAGVLGLDADIVPLGAAASAGTASKVARADHVHKAEHLPYMHVTSTSVINVPSGAWTEILTFSVTGSALDEDDDGLLDGGAGFKVPSTIDGRLWEVACGFRWSVTDGNRRHVRFNCSTAGIIRVDTIVGFSNCILMGTRVIRLAANETVHAELYQDTGAGHPLDPGDDLHFIQCRMLP